MEINKLFQKYEYCWLCYLLSSKQDSERPFSGHRVKLRLQLINYCDCFLVFWGGTFFTIFKTKKKKQQKNLSI